MKTIPPYLKIQSDDVHLNRCALTGERKLCIRFDDELLGERWKSFQCSRSKFDLLRMQVSLEALYDYWKHDDAEAIGEMHNMVFKIPKLLKCTLNLLERDRKYRNSDVQAAIRDVKRMMPLAIFTTINELYKSDLELQNSGLKLWDQPLFWRGYTGADANIFIQAFCKVLNDPFAFRNGELIGHYEKQLQAHGVAQVRLSPGVLKAEELRQTYAAEIRRMTE